MGVSEIGASVKIILYKYVRFIMFKAFNGFLFSFLLAIFAVFAVSCSSGGGGGGSNPPAPQGISGVVIIPSDYSGYTVLVCADADNSNSCDDGETTAEVDSNGAFSITTQAAYPLVAEFYPADGSLGTLPALVYTTPKGEKTLSAFTTMVKNNIDTQPWSYNAASSAEKVKSDTGISFNPFDADSYKANPTNASIHNKVSAVTAGILDYIYTSLGVENITAGVISALYNLIADIASDIANPSNNVDDLVSANEGSIDNSDIEEAENAIANAKNTTFEDWNYGSVISGLYSFFEDYDTPGVLVERLDFQNPEEVSLPTDTLPSPGSITKSELLEGGIVINRATVASPAKITTSERFSSKTFDLGEGAEVYTLISTQDFSKKVQSASVLRNIVSSSEYEDLDDEGYKGSHFSIFGFDETFAQTTYTVYEDTIVFYPDFDPQSGEFDWTYSGYIDPFDGELPFTKHGTFIKTANEAFKLTAEDDSVIILFKSPIDSSWFLAFYPVFGPTTTVFFNDVAAQAIIDQWTTNLTPLW
jgi:hypothetical protein